MSENENNAPKRAHPDDFGRIVAKIGVSQICDSVGFDSVKQSALEALTNVAIRYVNDLGKSASSYANLAGRSESNVFDIVKGLEDLGSSVGFSGSSEVNQCVVGSGVVKGISNFVGSVEDDPFVQPIPRFPVVKNVQLIPSFSGLGEIPSGKHIPDWLPAFPDPHTYLKSPVWNERKTNIRIDKGEQARQRRKAERSLLNLQQRLLLNGQNDNENENENESVVAVPPKNVNGGDRKQRSVRETFAPVIEALACGSLDPMEVDRMAVSERRPVVHFKLKAGEKMLVEDLDVQLKSMGNDRRGSWFPRDDEKDDKKRRVELILRQSMEYNNQEHSQM